MNLIFEARLLYPDEQRRLKTLKNQTKLKLHNKIKFYYFLVAGFLGVIFTYIATLTQESFWVLPSGTIAVFSFAFIIFTPFEMYKQKKRNKSLLQKLEAIIEKETVNTCFLKAEKIAVAKEFEDEGDLFIIELNNNQVLYFWDYDYNMRKKFPCLEFEIYEEYFFKLIGRQIYSLSERIKPVTIDKKAKWNYMKKIGAPGHLQIEDIAFDKIVNDFSSCT